MTKVAPFGIIILQTVIFILIYNSKNYELFIYFALNFAAILFSNNKLDLICIPLHSLYAKTLIWKTKKYMNYSTTDKKSIKKNCDHFL